MVTADDVVADIAQGVRNALGVSQQLLGAEAIDFEHPQIHPEYLVTVEVAKSLSSPERVVAMETHMDDMRTNARRLALRKALFKHKSRNNADYQLRVGEIDNILADPAFEFSGEEQGQGKKRVDIAVFKPDLESPILIAEAKLGCQSPAAIIADINRVICLLRLHKELDYDGALYGAVFFYRMLKGGTLNGLQGRAANLLKEVDAHLCQEQAKSNQNWLRFKAGLLTRGEFHEPIQAYEESHPDGTTESVFARKGFSFAPGLILLGSTCDVCEVTL